MTDLYQGISVLIHGLNDISLYDLFIAQVDNGYKLSSIYTKAAVKRHIKEIERSSDPDYPYYFDREEADRVIRFVKLLRHTDGHFAGKLFCLQPFQAFIIASIFGWRKKKNKKRRYRKAYVEVARKNGKSELAAALALYMFWKDNEPGAQVYTFATEKKQAQIVYDIAVEMLRMLWKDSPSAAAQIGLNKSEKKIFIKEGMGHIEPISDDHEKKDGLRPHMGINDEGHAMKNFSTLKRIESGFGTRDQPLIIIITTAGDNTFGPCYKFRKTCIKILTGEIESDLIFSIMFCLDPEDDWHDPKNWPKANPNIGASPTWDNMYESYELAITEGDESIQEFKTRRLNVWSDFSSAFISLPDWDASGSHWDTHILKGRKCWIGLESSRVKEIVNIIHVFPKDEGGFWVYSKFLMPTYGIAAKEKRDGVSYTDWISQGYIKGIEGKLVTNEAILDEILDSDARFDIQYIEYDKKYNYKLMKTVEDMDINVSAFSQSAANFTAPIKELESQVLLEQLDHGHNPVLRFMIGTAELVERTDHLMFDRTHPTVGGPVALAMAMGGYETDVPVSKVSYYANNPIDPRKALAS